MKIKYKSSKQNTHGLLKPIYYTLHVIEVTEANILDFTNFRKAFISNENICAFDEITNGYEGMNFPSIKNIKGNSFDVEIENYDDDMTDVIISFLVDTFNVNLEDIKM